MLPFTRTPCRVSIHQQILIIAAAPALIITMLLVFVIYQGNVQHNRRLLDQQGHLLATQLAAALEYSVVTGTLEQLPAIVDAAVQPATAILGTPVREVTVTDRDGHLLYRRNATPAATVGAWPGEPVITAEEPARFAVPIMLQPVVLAAAPPPAPRRLGEVTLELSTAAAQAHWQQRLAWDLGWVLLTFTGAVGLAYWIGRRLSGAIRRIATAILRIKSGDYATRVRPTDRNELGTLQEGVNLLADTLQRGQAHLEAELAKVRAEYQQALEALQVQSWAAERANQAKSLFLAKVSHEMRTPLYSIQGLIEQLLKTDRNEVEARTLRTILTAATTLYHHISDILDFTQLEKGKYTPMVAPLAVWDELDALVAPLEPLLVPRGLYLDVVVTPDVPAAVEIDGKALRAILANLLGNAVKYTESGGMVIQLDVVRPDNGTDPSCRPVLRVRVRDSGCGIPPDRLDTIFAPFEQVDEALNRRYPGTGLGLSIVKGYCDLLGGQVAVASTLALGSTFTVELPFRLPTEPISARPRMATLPAGRRALVANERASFRASVRARLGHSGMVVEEYAGSPTELVTMPAMDEPYDLLIVEHLAGWPETEQRAAVTEWRRWAPVLLALEPRYDAELDQRLRRAGSTLVLWSGATRSQLLAALARVLREVPSATEAEPGAVVSPTLPLPLLGTTVLVVEDYVINRMIMVNQLRENGAQVLEAPDGDTAVNLATEPGLDLILMDIQMPGKDGIAAIEDIRRLPAGHRLPILGFTASADKPTHQRILAAGANGVLTKPLGEADLVHAIRRALRRPPPAMPASGD